MTYFDDLARRTREEAAAQAHRAAAEAARAQQQWQWDIVQAHQLVTMFVDTARRQRFPTSAFMWSKNPGHPRDLGVRGWTISGPTSDSDGWLAEVGLAVSDSPHPHIYKTRCEVPTRDGLFGSRKLEGAMLVWSEGSGKPRRPRDPIISSWTSSRVVRQSDVEARIGGLSGWRG